MSIKLTRKQAAHFSIARLYTMDHTWGLFQSMPCCTKQYTTNIVDFGEAVLESKKVTDFLKGIRDSSLKIGKSIVCGDPATLRDFDESKLPKHNILIMSRQTMAKSSSLATTGGYANVHFLDEKMKGVTADLYQVLIPNMIFQWLHGNFWFVLLVLKHALGVTIHAVTRF